MTSKRNLIGEDISKLKMGKLKIILPKVQVNSSYYSHTFSRLSSSSIIRNLLFGAKSQNSWRCQSNLSFHHEHSHWWEFNSEKIVLIFPGFSDLHLDKWCEGEMRRNRKGCLNSFTYQKPQKFDEKIRFYSNTVITFSFSLVSQPPYFLYFYWVPFQFLLFSNLSSPSYFSSLFRYSSFYSFLYFCFLSLLFSSSLFQFLSKLCLLLWSLLKLYPFPRHRHLHQNRLLALLFHP